MFPDGQLYADLRGFSPSGDPDPPARVVRRFLDALGVAPQAVPADADAQAPLYRSVLAGKRMLVVLDNARDAAQVRPLLPGSAGCLVVITSRSQLAGLAAVEGAQLLPLGLLTEQEARELLAGRLGAGRVEAEPEAVNELIRLCARLPLALAITAARAAARPEHPLAALAEELHAADGPLDALDAGDPAASVRSVFSWSYRQLSPAAAQLFRLLGIHPGPDISVSAAASLAGIETAHARWLLAELTRAHLIAGSAHGCYAFHDLLRAYAAEQAHALDSDAARREALGRALDHYLHTADAAAGLVNPSRASLSIAPPEPCVMSEQLAGQRQALAWFEAEHRLVLRPSRAAPGSPGVLPAGPGSAARTRPSPLPGRQLGHPGLRRVPVRRSCRGDGVLPARARPVPGVRRPLLPGHGPRPPRRHQARGRTNPASAQGLAGGRGHSRRPPPPLRRGGPRQARAGRGAFPGPLAGHIRVTRARYGRATAAGQTLVCAQNASPPWMGRPGRAG